MQINNSSLNPPIQPLGQSSNPLNRSGGGRETSQQVDQLQRNERIDVDQRAISLLEQEKQSSNNNTSYDQPSKRNTTAVTAYQSVGNLEQRESVQQLLGVDIFA
ncbi:hypothetical protein [Thalassotalea atypica]|uniref:hypothetical protein n=1 Tax=Thalassotalea atypica TaxID=2054316 RepID=UPI002573D3D1|nr:hypothetical protein [Thalassotalea atypica]